MLEPIGLVTGGLLSLPALLGGAGDGAGAASTRDYADALVQSNGAINDSILSRVADTF